jgi:general secretion pathway protein D
MNRRAAGVAASRLIFRIALLSLLAALSAGTVRLHAQSAKSWYKQGQSAEAREDFDNAFNDFQKAYSMAPKEMIYKEAFYRVQIPAAAVHMKNGRRLLATGDEQGALMEFIRASEIDPSDQAAQQQIDKVRALHKEQAPPNTTGIPGSAGEENSLDTIASPVQLRPVSNEPLTLHMVQDSKVIYQAVGEAAGVNVLFDPDYTGKRIQVDLTNVSLLDALRIVGTLSTTFWRPITANTIFVAANTRSKRSELDEQAVQTFYLTNAWQQNDLQDVQTAIRNVLPNAHAYGVASQNAIVMRGTPDELLLAQKLVNDLDKARPEVVVDIAVLEVNKSWQRTLGIAWPQSASVQLQSPAATSSSSSSSSSGSSSTSTNPTLFNLAHLNSNDFAVTIGTATANALLSDSATKTLQNPRIRSTDGQKASMKIGERIPIATGSFQSGVGVAAAVTPLAETQFQYIDSGVVIDMTPTVHYNGDVTMKLSIEVSSEGSPVTIEGVQEPQIIQKKSEQTIRLRQGEATVLTGILNQQDIQSWSGIPGLSSIPILKYLFGSKDHQITDDEVVFLLVPHIVRAQDLTQANLQAVDTGTGQYTEIRRVALDNSPPSISPIAQPARPPVEAHVGAVPGSSAQAAAPGALQQFRDSAQGTAPPPTPNATSPPAQPGGPPGGMRFSLVPSGGSSVATGATFQVPVVVTGAKDIASVPLQVQYDASKLALVNVGDGDFLQSDGQAVALVHRDDGPGNIVINASRPPGSVGVSGAGVVCVLTFQAKAAGPTQLGITHPSALTSAQQPVQAEAAQTTIVVK